MTSDTTRSVSGTGSEALTSAILSRRQAVAGLGLFGLFLTAPALVGSDRAEAKAIDAAAEAEARREAEANERVEAKSDEQEVAELADGDTATDFSSQWYWRRRRYRRRYFVVRRRYWRRRYWRRRRWW